MYSGHESMAESLTPEHERRLRGPEFHYHKGVRIAGLHIALRTKLSPAASGESIVDRGRGHLSIQVKSNFSKEGAVSVERVIKLIPKSEGIHRGSILS